MASSEIIGLDALSYYLLRITTFLKSSKKTLLVPKISAELEEVLLKIVRDRDTRCLQSDQFDDNVIEEVTRLTAAMDSHMNIKLAHEFQDGQHGPNVLMFRKIEVNEIKAISPLRKPYEVQARIKNKLAEDNLVTTFFKTHCLNVTTKFVKDDQQLVMRYPEMAECQAEFLMSMLLQGKEGKTGQMDSEIGYRSLYAALWESMRLFALKYDYNIQCQDKRPGFSDMKCVIFEKIPIKFKVPEKRDMGIPLDLNSSLSTTVSTINTSTSTDNNRTPKKHKEKITKSVSKVKVKLSKMHSLITKIMHDIGNGDLTEEFIKSSLSTIDNYLSTDVKETIVFERMTVSQEHFLNNVKRLCKHDSCYMLFNSVCQSYLINIKYYLTNEIKYTVKVIKRAKNDVLRDIQIEKTGVLTKVKQSAPLTHEKEHNEDIENQKTGVQKIGVKQSAQLARENNNKNPLPSRVSNTPRKNKRKKTSKTIKDSVGETYIHQTLLEISKFLSKDNTQESITFCEASLDQELFIKNVHSWSKIDETYDMFSKADQKLLMDIKLKAESYILRAVSREVQGFFTDEIVSNVTIVKKPATTVIKQEDVASLKKPATAVIKQQDRTSVNKPAATVIKQVDVTSVKKPATTVIKQEDVTSVKKPATTLIKQEDATIVQKSATTVIKQDCRGSNRARSLSAGRRGKSVKAQPAEVSSTPSIKEKLKVQPAEVSSTPSIKDKLKVQPAEVSSTPSIKEKLKVQPAEESSTPSFKDKLKVQPAEVSSTRSIKEKQKVQPAEVSSTPSITEKLKLQPAEVSSTPSIKEKLKEGLNQPVQSDKALKMMQSMGWKGGALGLRGVGITEPIMPAIDHARRAGLGHVKPPPKPPKSKKQKKTGTEAAQWTLPPNELLPRGILPVTSLQPYLIPTEILPPGTVQIGAEIHLDSNYRVSILEGILQLITSDLGAIHFIYLPQKAKPVQVIGFIRDAVGKVDKRLEWELSNQTLYQLLGTIQEIVGNFKQLRLHAEYTDTSAVVKKWPLSACNNKTTKNNNTKATAQKTKTVLQITDNIDLTGLYTIQVIKNSDGTRGIRNVYSKTGDASAVAENTPLWNINPTWEDYKHKQSNISKENDQNGQNGIITVKTVQNDTNGHSSTDNNDEEIIYITLSECKVTEYNLTDTVQNNNTITKDKTENITNLNDKSEYNLTDTVQNNNTITKDKTENSTNLNGKSNDKIVAINEKCQNDETESSIEIGSDEEGMLLLADQDTETDKPTNVDDAVEGGKEIELLKEIRINIEKGQLESDEISVTIKKDQLESDEITVKVDRDELDSECNQERILVKRPFVDSPDEDHIIKKSKILADFKKLCIVQKDGIKITREKAREIQTSILNGVEMLPLLKCEGIQNGGLLYTCQDNKSVCFMEDLIKTMDDLRIEYEIDVKEKLWHKMAFRLNSYLDEDFTEVLKRLELFNLELNVSKWEFIKKEQYAEFVVIYVELDGDSFRYVCDANFSLYIGNDCAKFSIVWD